MRKTGRTKFNEVYSLRKPSIFILTLFTAFVLIFGAASLIAYHSYRSAINSAIHVNGTKADLISKIVWEHQRAAIGIVHSYTSRPLLIDAVKKKEFEAAVQHLTDLSKTNPEIETSWISNPDSTPWVNFPADRQSYGKDLSYREWYMGPFSFTHGHSPWNSALRVIRAKAKEYNIDPNRIGVWGTSRGGHLAAMLAFTRAVWIFIKSA